MVDICGALLGDTTAERRCAQEGSVKLVKDWRLKQVGRTVSAESCFFFSSRRRHTRFDCDWSSDVCSSDLGGHSESAVSMALPGRAARKSGGLTDARRFFEKNLVRAVLGGEEISSGAN